MSFFPPGGGAGGGGGWPPHQFFNQPPPGIPPPMPFYQDPSQNQGFPPGIPPEFQQQQQGYNPYAQMQIPIPGQPPQGVAPPQTQHQSQPQPQQMVQVQEIPSSIAQVDNHGRDRKRSENKPPEYLPQEHSRRSRKDDDVDSSRSARRKRSPTEEMYRRRESEERSRQREQGRPDRSTKAPQAHSSQDKHKVDIDALLQDERLRNVLFAGISKATAKLEQSLQDGKGRSDFEPQEAKNQSFSSPSTSQMPRSILKRKETADSGGSKALTSLSALERTLHMLRGKGDVPAESTQPVSRSPSGRKSPNHGALGQLAAYDEGNEEDGFHHKGDGRSKQKDTPASTSQPFWSVPSPLEASKRESDSFDAKEKMFEEWRQSISRKSDASAKTEKRERDMYRGAELQDYKRSLKKREMPVGEADNREELDSTVQNILQSIGFNFDLSKRMQELAKKKRMQEDGGSGIRNVSASFLDKGDLLAEELKASLIRSGSDLSSIDSLIKEVRASSQGSRHNTRVSRSPSPDRQRASFGREVKDRSPDSSRYEHTSREDYYRRSKDTRSSYPGADQWQRESPQSSPPRRHFREVSPPLENYADLTRQSNPIISERLRDDGERNEYFYPEKDYADTPLSVPLLTSLSSRKRDEDLTGGLLKSLRVENLRVMSRPHDNPDDDSYREMRRVILPAKSDLDKNRSPPRTVLRKRSASPMAMPVSKERKTSPGHYDDYPRRRSPSTSYQEVPPPKELPRHRSPPPRRDRSWSPQRRRTRSRTRSRSPQRRRASPRRRSRSPRRRSRSPRRRSRSPRRRSRSPRRRSRSPYRGRSRSPGGRRRSPPRRPSPRRGRRTPPPRPNDRNSSSTKSTEGSAYKYRASQGDGKVPSKDTMKITEKERETETKKMAANKGKDVQDDKKSFILSTILTDISSMTEIEPLQVSRITAEVLLLDVEQHQKAISNLAERKSKVATLKAELQKLKKSQNVLMRKSQRSGLGNSDPHLKANNLSQLETESEISRLSAPELSVSLASNYELNLKDIQKKLEKNTANVKPKKNEKKLQESDSDKKTSIAQAMEPSKQTNWTSVQVEDADLPEIAIDNRKKNGKKKPVKENEKRTSVPPKQKKNIYYEYVDGKNHWCGHCRTTLNALDQFYGHLHGKKHFTVISEVPKPWVNPDDGNVKEKGKVGKAQVRRIKGSEMLFPITGFYCTLCKTYCGDFTAADQHLKSDCHYDNYLEFIRENSDYEKKLLLEKTGKGKGPQNFNETPQQTPSSGKKGTKSKSLRKKKESQSNQDNLESVDMELDDDNRDSVVNVTSKVPKMSGKFANSVASILSTLPESGDNSNGVEMKSSIDDGVKSLDKFLTIAETTNESGKKKKQKKKSGKIPVIDDKEGDLTTIPIPELPKLTAIPLPPGDENVPCTVKTLKEVEDEEKRMMGIDVDAAEEKPLGLLKRPPPLSTTSGDKTEEGKKLNKPKRLDSLLSKVALKSSSSSLKQKIKPDGEASELEKIIEQGIQEKLEKEREKLKREQEKKERREKKLEEKRLMKMKKKVISDSTSEEDSDLEDEIEEEKTPCVNTEAESVDVKDINLPKTDSDEGMKLESEKGEIKEPTEKVETPEEGEQNVEAPSECKSKSDYGTNSSISMNIDCELTNSGEVQIEEKNNTISSVNSELSSSATMELIGLSNFAGLGQQNDIEMKDTEVLSNEGIDKGVSQEAIVSDDCGKPVGIAVEAASKPFENVAGKSEDVSVEIENKNVEELLDSDVPKFDSSSSQIPELSKDPDSVEMKCVEGDANSKPKGTGKKNVKLTKTAMLKVLQSESDLLGVLNSSPELLAGTKNQSLKRAGAKRGGKAGNRSSARNKKSILKEESDVNVSMDAFVVLSEVAEENNISKGEEGNVTIKDDMPACKDEDDNVTITDDMPAIKDEEVNVTFKDDMSTSKDEEENVTIQTDMHESKDEKDNVTITDNVPVSKDEEDNVTIEDDVSAVKDEEVGSSVFEENSGVEKMMTSNNEGDKTGKVEEKAEDKTEPVKSALVVRGGKASRGKGRGKKTAMKKEAVVLETPVTAREEDSIDNSSSIKEDGPFPETENIADSTASFVEVKEKEVVELVASEMTKTRRGRSATAKTTPAKSVRQTRTRGKKKEVEPEPPVENKEDKSIDVTKTGDDENIKADNQSLDTSVVPVELNDAMNEASTSADVKEEENVNPTCCKPSKVVTVMVIDEAVQNITAHEEDEGKTNNNTNKNTAESKTLLSKEANVDMGSENEKSKGEDGDSDATITDDIDDISPQTGAESSSQNEVASDFPVLNTSMYDMTSVTAETDHQVESEMIAETTEEMPIVTSMPDEFDIPSAHIDLGLNREDDPMGFPDSLVGFTVLDVEGQPDDENDDDMLL